MQHNVVYQEKDRPWMAHAVFYIVIAALVAAIFSFALFFALVAWENQKIAALDQKISQYGTDQQKQDEKTVLDERKKIGDFAALIANHKLPSNVFTFLEGNTLPGVVFSGFTVSVPGDQLRLSGSVDSMATLAKQFTVLENNTGSISNISVLNSQTDPSGKISFVFNISLSPGIFHYANQ